MIERECPSFFLTIFVAGDPVLAKQVCRRFCMHGLCVTIEPTTYIYTGGEEVGVRVGLINYPRFPGPLADLWVKAINLAELLRAELCQHSYSIVGPDKTIWSSARDAA